MYLTNQAIRFRRLMFLFYFQQKKGIQQKIFPKKHSDNLKDKNIKYMFNIWSHLPSNLINKKICEGFHFLFTVYYKPNFQPEMSERIGVSFIDLNKPNANLQDLKKKVSGVRLMRSESSKRTQPNNSRSTSNEKSPSPKKPSPTKSLKVMNNPPLRTSTLQIRLKKASHDFLIESNASKCITTHEDDSIKDSKIQGLFSRIMKEESNLVYQTEEDSSKLPQSSRDYDSIVPERRLKRAYSGTSAPKIQILNSIIKHNVEREHNQGYDFERKKPTLLTGKSFDSIKSEAYRFSLNDSKFKEILNLKKQNAELSYVNEALKQEMDGIDEFEKVLSKRTKIENFNEKRCDMLKAALEKQKKYIAQLTSSVKLSNKFSKDLAAVLKFLVNTVDRSKKKEDPQDQLKAREQLAGYAFNQLKAELDNINVLKAFMVNFNDAYEKIKKIESENEDLGQMFDLPVERGNQDGAKLETQKKIKYKYVLRNFAEKHKHVFPPYSIFKEMDLQEKLDFTEALKQLQKMTITVDETFKKLKNYDTITHSQYVYNENIPTNYQQNINSFGYYFHNLNKTKRIVLNGNELLTVERSLSQLLGQLINFHNELTTKGHDIAMHDILKLQHNVRTNIESLLTLGVTVACNISHKDQIIVVTKQNNCEDEVNPLRGTSIPKTKLLFEIYKDEHENVRKFEGLMDNMKKLLDQSMKEADKEASKNLLKKLKSLNECMECLQINYEDMGLMSRLKDIEMNFTREYSKILDGSMNRIKSFVEEEGKLVDEFLEKIHSGIKELGKSYESTHLQESKGTKSQKVFLTVFRKMNREIKDASHGILGKRKEIDYGETRILEDIFLKDFEKICEEYKKNRARLKKIGIKLQKDKE